MTGAGERPLVFILEDDQAFREVLVRAFDSHGFATESFRLGRALERRLADRRPALCLVDLQLPDGPGLDLVVRSLARLGIPVILISGVWTDLGDRVKGLELGADDYLVKPFSPREAVARARAILRRCRPDAGGPETEVARFAGWTVDFRSFQLIAPDGTEVEVTASEVRLLRSFLTMPRRVLTREALMDAEADAGAGGGAYDRSIDVRISRLRQKLGEDPRNPKLIKTVYGSGYMFTAAIDWLPAAVP